MADKARSVIDTILGEAVSGTPDERFTDMLGIASTIANRAAMTGQTPESIISAPGQYSAYGNRLPSGTKAYRSLAQKAWDRVQTVGPIHEGTYYATPSATKNLPSGLQAIARTTGHQYFADPMSRSIRTAKGFVQPTVEAAARVAENVSRATGSVVNAAARAVGLQKPGPGLAALAPNGLLDLPSRAQPTVSYNMGPNRPNAPRQSVVNIARSAVNDVLGPGYGVNVISGRENKGRQYGSNRHKTGLAADIQITTPNGRTLNAVKDRQAMADVAQAMAAKGALGIGVGANYMGAKGIHVDQVTPGPGQAHTWGELGKKNADALTGAMRTKEMPASYYARSLPAQMQAPTARMNAPLSPVSRAPLSAPKATQPAPERFAPTAAPSARAASSLATKGSRVTAQPSAARMAPSASLVSAPVGPAGPMARAQDPGTLTAAGGVVSPARPDNKNYQGPKGAFSVTPTPAPGMVRIGPNAAVQNVAYRAPNPAPVPAQPARVAPAVPMAPPVNRVNPVKQSRLAPPVQPVQRLAPVRQAAPAPSRTISQAPRGPSVRDVYSGTIGTATATDGNRVTRDAFGNIGITNSYGVTSWSSPDGRGISKVSNPLGALGPTGKGILGSLAGGAIGSAVAGPVGGLVGSYLGNRAIGGTTQPTGQQNGMGLLGGLLGGLGLGLGGGPGKGSGGGSRGGASSGSRGGASRGGSNSSDRSNSGWGK